MTPPNASSNVDAGHAVRFGAAIAASGSAPAGSAPMRSSGVAGISAAAPAPAAAAVPMRSTVRRAICAWAPACSVRSPSSSVISPPTAPP